MTFFTLLLCEIIVIIRPVDIGHSHIHLLDQKTMLWSIPNPVQSADFLDKPIQIAEADIIRAKQRIETETSRGLAAGRNCHFYFIIDK
jgi:hypothetical protein